MTENHVIEEIKRRQTLAESIDSIISRYFAPVKGRRLKRGAVQELIMACLKLERTNELCNLINQRMELEGYIPYIIKGTLYYKGVSLLPSNQLDL
jgi:hypothetical protein